jgi:uncharacterized protein YoxC
MAALAETCRMPELDDQAMLRESIAKFKTALDYRDVSHLRIAKRVTLIIRIGMISLAVIALALLLLVFVLTYYIQDAITALETMNRHFRSMQTDMVVMKSKVSEMDTRVASLPMIVNSVSSMDQAVGALNADIGIMLGKIRSMNLHMNDLTGNVATMTNQFAVMDASVYAIARGVNTMSSAMRPLNNLIDLFPFRW